MATAPFVRPTLLVGGVDYTDYLVPRSLSFQGLVQQGVQTVLAYSLKQVPNTFEVQGGQVIEFYLAGQTTPLFSGIQTKSIPKHYGPGSWMPQCQASGWEQIFYRKQLFTAFRGLTFQGAVNQVLADAEQTYPSALVKAVQDPASLLLGDMPFYAVNGAYPGAILNLVANLTNTVWRVVWQSGQLVLEFVDPFANYQGFLLSDDNHTFKWSTFLPVIDLENIVNTQSVRGSQVATHTAETAYFRGDGLSSQFDLPSKPFNNTASVILFDSFNTSPINTGIWFESDIVGDYVAADGEGFVQYEPNANAWVGLISHALAGRDAGPMTTIDINWVEAGVAMFGLTKLTEVPSDAFQFLEAGVYLDATGKVFGVANGTSLGDAGVTLTTDSQYRFRITCKSAGGCKIEYQADTNIYTRNWTLLFETSAGTGDSLGTAVMSYSAGLSLAMVKTVYLYLSVTLEVDRGSGFQTEEVGIYPIDEDVDAVILEESVLAFFGSDPGPSTIPPAPTWQDDPDYKNIRVSYFRGVNIFATYSDTDTITDIQNLFGDGDSGIREGPIITDDTITSYQAALAKGKTVVDNQGNLISQITAQSSYNTLHDAGVSLPVMGDTLRFSVSIPPTGYTIQRDIPLRKLKIQAKEAIQDLDVTVEAGYLQRGLRTVLQELTQSGQLISLSEDQVIYLGKSVPDPIVLTETVSSFGSGNTRRWGDSRLSRTFTVNTSTEVLTTNTAALFVTGDDVQVSSTDTLPGGLTAGSVYYINRQSATTFLLYDTLTHAQVGGSTGKIDLTSAGTGTHTLMANAWRWGNHRWNSFISDVNLMARSQLRVSAHTYKLIQLQAEGVLNVRAKVNGV